MIYGDNGNMWITWAVSDARAEPIYNLVLGCNSVQEVENRLLDAGLEFIEIRGAGRKREYLYANDADLVSIYLFQGTKLSVSIRSHDSKSIKQLKRFWNSFESVRNMQPIELQE